MDLFSMFVWFILIHFLEIFAAFHYQIFSKKKKLAVQPSHHTPRNKIVNPFHKLGLVFLSLLTLAALSGKAAAGTWAPTGGPEGGYVQTIAISPSFAEDKTIFASPQAGGVLKSTNGGASWTAANTGLGVDFIFSVALSPNYAVDQTIFAGTANSGVFKSTNGGASWTRLAANGRVTSLAISPNYVVDQTIFAGNFGVGVLKSIDGGATWTTTNAGLSGANALAVQYLAISPNYAVDHTIFVSTYNGNVSKSTDGGASWTAVLGHGEFIAISPNYAVDHTVFVNGLKSTDGGATWTDTGLFAYSLAFSPNYAVDQTIFAGTYSNGDVFKSTNGGTTWTATNTRLTHFLPVNSIALSPNFVVDQTIFAGTFAGGAIKSTNGGATWTSANTGLISQEISHLALSPNYVVDQTIFAGTRDLFKSTNGGQSWQLILSSLSSLAVSPLAISPNFAVDQTIFAGNFDNGLFKSTNGGSTWTHTNLFAYSLAISPNFAVDQTIFAGTNSGVFKSTNGGAGWTAANSGLGVQSVLSLALSPNYAVDQTIFAGTNDGGVFSVFKSTNGGASWSAASTNISNNRGVTSLVLSPNYAADQTIFAGTALAGVFRSTNGGASWTAANVGGGGVGTFLAISPNYAVDHTVFAASSSGELLKSNDGGASWTRVFGELFFNPALTTLAISPGYPCDGTIFIGTRVSSVWKYTDTEAMATCVNVPTVTTTAASSIASTSVTLNGNVNPNGSATTVWFEWGASSTLTTYNQTPNQSIGSGTTSQAVSVNLGGLTSGTTYYYRVAASNGGGTVKGSILSFTTTTVTQPPTASIEPASSITATSVVLSCSVNPNGLTTTVWFEWGTASSYGNTTQSQSIPAGTGSVSVTQSISGLLPGTTYHFRVVAQNSTGISYGSDQVFTTPSTGASGWAPIGPDGGVIKGGVISPSFNTDQTMFVVSQNHVLFKSLNGGTNWMPINTGLNNRIGVVAISPNYATDQTLFAGTSNHSGILKSTDGGTTWTDISINLGANVYINVLTSIMVSPNYVMDQTLFAGTATGIFKSTSGGVSWFVPNTGFNELLSSLATSGPLLSLAMSPNYATDQTLLAGTGGGGVFKSTDGGLTWTAVNSALRVNNLVISASYATDQTIFVNVGSTGAIYKSANAGVTWTAVNTPWACGCYTVILSPNYAIDQTLFAGTNIGVFKSIDGGITWTKVTGLGNTPTFFLAISPGYATDQTLFVGKLLTGGIFKSTDGGTNWIAVNTGLRALYALQISISPNYSIDSTIFVATDAGIYKSTDEGATWNAVNSGLQGVNGLQIVSISVSPDYGRDQTLFAGSWGVSKSTNGATTWTSVNSGLSNLQVLSLALSPNYSIDQTIFVGTWGGVFKSTNGGSSWTAVNSGLSNLNIFSLVVSPNYSMDETLFAATNGGGVFKSTNGGLSWTAVNSGLSGPLVVSPNFAKDQTIFAGGGTAVYKSTNGGLSWVAVNTGLGTLGITSFAISPNYEADQTLFVATYDGVYKSANGGVTWTAVSTGLSFKNLVSLAISPGYPCDGTLLGGTSGYSVWKYLDAEAIATCTPPPVPTITSINPSSAVAGTFDLTINGSNFDAGAVDQIYTPTGAFMGQGMIKSRSSTQIVVTEFMSGAGPGDYAVKVKTSDGQLSNGVTLTITACAHVPGEGTTGSQLTAFQNAYARAGGQSVLGCATRAVEPARSSGALGSTATGLVQWFAHGHIHLIGGSTTAYATIGVIDELYVDMGGTASELGFPTSAPYIAADGSLRQDFEGGVLSTDSNGVTSRSLSGPPPTLIKSPDRNDYRVYYVSKTGAKFHIPDPETFEILGFDWSTISPVATIEPNPPSLPVLRTGNARDGSLIRRKGAETTGYKVYLIEKGISRHVPDPYTLFAMGRRFNEVIDLDAPLFDRIPKGPEIPSIDPTNPGPEDETFIDFASGLGLNGAAGYEGGVNLATGNYTHSRTDLKIPGRGLPFVFTMTYNAKDSYDHVMGPGWTHSYDMEATETQKTPLGSTTPANVFVRVKWGDGHEEFYEWDGSAYAATHGVRNTLTGGGGAGTLTVTTKAQVRYTLELLDSTPENSQDRAGHPTVITTNRYRLKQISDRNSNALSLNYKSGPDYQYCRILSSISDTVGRTVGFAYSETREPTLRCPVVARITTVTDPIVRTVELTYDVDGKIIAIKDPNGETTQYAYKKERVIGMPTPLIESITDPEGHQVVDAIYAEGVRSANYKKTGSISVAGSPRTIVYDASTATATVTDPSAFATTYIHDAQYRVTRLEDALGSITGAYDANCGNDPAHVTDRRGGQTGVTCDERGNALTITNALTQVTRVEYDSRNNPTRRTDALGRVTTYTYDANGNLTQITAPIGRTTITYNSYGQPVSITDPNGNVTSYGYDAQGNLTDVNQPLGRTLRYAYDAVGRKISETDANNHTTTYTYDNRDQLLSVTDPLPFGNSERYGYFKNGNLMSVTDKNGNATTYAYDVRNRRTAVTDALDHSTTYAYDNSSRLLSTTDAERKTTRYEYDAVGNLTKVTDAANGTVLYTYDANGNRFTMQDPNGHITRYAYDALNRLIRRTEPLGNAYQYAYDAVGNTASMTDAKGATTRYTYDAMNRLVRASFADGSAFTFTYDANGNRLTIIDTIGTSTYAYDALNRLTSYTNPFGQTVGYGYDANSNRTSLTYPDGKVVRYAFDELNRLTTVTDWLNQATTYSYDAASRLAGTVNPNATTVTYSYDTANRLTSLLNRKSDVSVISSYSYVLDAVGNHLQVTQTEPLQPIIRNQNSTYGYDAENRVTTAGGLNYEFDANGNMTRKGGDTFSYDQRDKLVQSVIGGAATQYQYDGVSNRLSKTSAGQTTRYILDINAELPNVVAETDATGTMLVYYVYGLGLISKVLPDGTTSYYHYDSRGSAVALSNSAQDITDAYAYDPFGKVVSQSGSTPNPFKYVGGYGLMDEGNGLTYVRARYYMPEAGRFVTKDLLMGEDGDGQSVHRYVYAINNPVIKIDLSGYLPSKAERERRIKRQKTQAIMAQYDYIAALETEAAYWEAMTDVLEATEGALGAVGGLFIEGPKGVISGLGKMTSVLTRNLGYRRTAKVINIGSEIYDLQGTIRGLPKQIRSTRAVINAVSDVGVQNVKWGRLFYTETTNSIVESYSDAMLLGRTIIGGIRDKFLK